MPGADGVISPGTLYCGAMVYINFTLWENVKTNSICIQYDIEHEDFIIDDLPHSYIRYSNEKIVE